MKADIIAVEFPSSHPHFPAVDWNRFRGNNHERLETSWRNHGSVSFTRHIGKPLSEDLWVDLVHRLCVKSLRIYKNQEEWTDGVSSCARVYLDANDNVTEISYTP